MAVPFLYGLLLNKILPKGKLRILELGCGKGDIGETINRDKKHNIIGVDIFAPYIKIANDSGFYTKVLKADITSYPIKDKFFDVIIACQVIEHLKDKNAKKLITASISRTRKKVIITVPNGECDQDEYDENPFQKHQSEWTVEKFRSLNFRVYGQGLKFVYGTASIHESAPKIWQYLLIPISFIAAPFVFFVPKYAAQLIAVYEKN